MGLFSFHYDNKTNLIFLTAIMWIINFRTSFKNIDSHMDTGCYSSVKYDPLIILIKNISCLIFVIGYIYEKKITTVKFVNEKIESQKLQDDSFSTNSSKLDFVITKKEKMINEISFNDVSLTIMNEKNNGRRFSYYIKIYFCILIIYAIEEFYFIIDNNHILDRIIVNMRNFCSLIFLLLFSPLIIKRSTYVYRHQLFPCIIILAIALFMILYNVFGIERFKKVFGYNLISYFICFFLMGLQFTLIKYLLSIEFTSMYLLLFVKGLFGTIIFTIINVLYNKAQFFIFFDKLLHFEYEGMDVDFSIIQKIGYVLTLIIIQYLIIFTINTFSHTHILISIMLSELIYFPIYIIERFAIQEFKISNFWSFVLNFCIGAINVLLMLVFNEILECKFLGLNTNLKRNINKRQNDDYRKGKRELNIEIEDEKEQEKDEGDKDNENENDNYNLSEVYGSSEN